MIWFQEIETLGMNLLQDAWVEAQASPWLFMLKLQMIAALPRFQVLWKMANWNLRPKNVILLSHNRQLYRKRLADPSHWPWRARLLQTYLSDIGSWAAWVPKKIVRSWESFRKSVVKHNETHQVDPFQTFTMELKSFFLGKNYPPTCGQGAPEPQLACCTCGSVPTPGEARHRNATFHGDIYRRTERINQIDIKKTCGNFKQLPSSLSGFLHNSPPNNCIESFSNRE